MNDERDKREKLDYETPTRPPYSTGASVVAFLACAFAAPIAAIAATLGVFGLMNGSAAGLLGLLVGGIAAFGVIGAIRERGVRAAGIAGALTGLCVVVLLAGVCFGRF